MKQLLFACTALVCMASCNNDTKVAGSSDSDSHMKMSEKQTAGMKTIYKAIETGDVSGVDSLLADDVVDHNANPKDGSDLKGKDAVKQMLGDIHNHFDNLKMELLQDATSNDGEYHFATVRMTGKAKDNVWGMKAGQEMDDTSVDVVKMKDGKATEHWGFMSMKDMMEMMPPMQSMPMDTTKMKH